MERLNREQMLILEENHGLIKGFLKERKLEIREYYSLITDSLVKAILAYDESKGKLSTLFYRIAKNDLAYVQRKDSSEVLGLKEDFSVEYERLVDSGYLSLEQTEEDEVYRDEEENFDVSVYLSYLEDFEIKICNMLYEGRVQREIAEAFGVSQQSINKRIKIIRRKVKEAIGNGYRTEHVKEHIR